MKKIKIGVIGLGYVGLPVSVAFSEKYDVVGYDINSDRVELLNKSEDNTLEISSNKLKHALNKNLKITSKASDIKSCNFYIVTVPTPINKDKTPDLTALISATNLVGKMLTNGDIVVYESTVYPGCTEEICVPILEKESNLKFNKDFYCGYSPERINPGDNKHTIDKIVKVTSGSTKKIAIQIDEIYSSVISAGTFMAESIKVAEAAKVIENTQRDINIAFINELAKIFEKMGIDTNDVLDAASTKWNFLNFRPGLVGGHCIGVDPYYLADKSIKSGYFPNMILAGREINDSMSGFICDNIFKMLNEKKLKSTNALVMGVTFKENCPDFRNTKVLDLIVELKKKINVDIFDPWVEKKMFEKQTGLLLTEQPINKKYDLIIMAVSHKIFQEIDLDNYKKDKSAIIYDIKGSLDKKIITARL